MKKILISTIFLCLGIHSYAQKFNGTIVNNSNEPLSGATIIAHNDSLNGVMSTNDGSFTIHLQNSNEVIVSFLGYITKKATLTSGINTIRLTEDNVALDEVLVTSASREIQKRSEVPGSISTISARTINETKAFGIDQLVNQVPGVFMATSRAASNEQHFMAVRSPISTKALFLYLEDGLQIRPTSVFNHNALLEMNDISYGRLEVLKGPASSIYGSESIGGSFNFITKNPTEKLSGSIGFQTNDIGLSRYELEVADTTNDRFGFYLGGHYVQRKDGPIEHSDYEKLALTFKTVYDLSSTAKWTTVFDIVDYRSDMTGSISEADYTSGNFESDQTFTEREAIAFRIRTTVDKFWNTNNKTSFNFIVRDNKMDQNPSYRIRQFRDQGQLTGFGSGEINSNQFRSFVGLIQHKLDFNIANSSLIIGATGDFSPQKYVAETTSITVDPTTGRNIDFNINSGDFILNYEADIFNYAGFLQYEISPIDPLKITAAIRYDGFEYDYDNQVDEIVGVEDAVDNFNNLTPKLGVNYNFSNQTGIYANYSQGFTPPQVSTLYRNRNQVQGIKPSRYNNYEIGGYFSIPLNIRFDAAIYVLEGKNTLITLRDEDDNFFNTNAGKTRSYGIEYGVSWKPIKALSIAHNGSYAKHQYIDFFDSGIDYSDTERETAPSLLGTSLITYNKKYGNFGVSITGEHELVGGYNTSFENQIENDDGTFDTATYDGHNVFNLRAVVNYNGFEIWAHVLNIFDELYAARASYNRFRNENSFTIGNPRSFHLGVRYNF
ncbi:TonB-dependent receptor domain-containing protein [Aquimarina sp. 2201CG14-23]|uniref:TonB-dependent receptor domain-containing protein n=1 Tax=Aquimarina mycalae TaxID=3040073 RepID=UPI0024782A9D|nr:TonB-dependent receptor [Aquimarina sp. 2201CG14-23]MDH7448330.1 TonB-dependent receptor [Aquimarina sp. 2201CG14-23]